jgi:hypothetical protein
MKLKKKIGVKKDKKDWCQPKLTFYTRDMGHKTRITALEKSRSLIHNQFDVEG